MKWEKTSNELGKTGKKLQMNWEKTSNEMGKNFK